MLWLLSFLSSFRFFFFGHMEAGGFPRPLSPKEEAECLERLRAGDARAGEKLIEHNMRLVAHIAKKYACGRDTDDLISVGSVGLIKAVNTFNTEKCARLGTYAARCIDNEILMYLRASKKQNKEVSLSEPVGVDPEGNAVTLMDLLKDETADVPENVEKRLSFRAVLKKMRERLDARERTVIVLRYGLGGRKPLSQREVALRLGISRSYVSRIEKAALEKLKF